MKIALTGIAGFIGSHLAAQLVSRGDEVVGLDSFDDTLYPRFLHERNLQPILDRVRVTEGDILDVRCVDDLLAEKPDVVVHLAALAGVRSSLEQPIRYQRVNVEGTLNVLEACRRRGVARFVFASSSSVYGVRSSAPFREDDAADRPASLYAATKRAGELLVVNYAHLYGIASTALRFFTVYGPRQRPEMAIHKFARLILERKPLPLFGDGASARDYTYVDDIVEGTVAAIDRCDGGRHRVYNLGGSRPIPLSDVVKLLEQNLGERAIVELRGAQPGDVPVTSADVTLAGRELGYSPRVPIEEGIARFSEWVLRERARLPAPAIPSARGAYAGAHSGESATSSIPLAR